MLSGLLNISKLKNIRGNKVAQQPQNSYLQSERLTDSSAIYYYMRRISVYIFSSLAYAFHSLIKLFG